MKSEGKLESTLRKIKTKKHNKPNLKEAAKGCLQENLQTYIKKNKNLKSITWSSTLRY